MSLLPGRSAYLGSKGGAGVYQAIISQFPPHSTYIETHLGSGVILNLKPPATRSIGIDKSQLAIDKFVYSGSAIDNFDYSGLLDLIVDDCRQWLIDNSDFVTSDTLIYADPPYLLATRTSKARYQYEYTEQDHIDLLQTFLTMKACILISGYPSTLYDEILKGWRTIEFQAMTRGGVRTEKLWMNYEHKPHWHTYAGADFTDRQRIKRKAFRWRSDFSTLSELERLAILAELMASYG